MRGKLWAWSMYTPGRTAQTAARLAQPRVQMLGSHQAPPAGASPAPTALNLPSTLQWNTALDAVSQMSMCSSPMTNFLYRKIKLLPAKQA